MILSSRLLTIEQKESEEQRNGLNVMVATLAVILLLISESNASVKPCQEKNHMFVLKKASHVRDVMVLFSMVLEDLTDTLPILVK